MKKAPVKGLFSYYLKFASLQFASDSRVKRIVWNAVSPEYAWIFTIVNIMGSYRMDKTEQISRRHHFVPRFYLKAWTAEDAKGLWLYQRDFNDQIRSDRRPTKAVGYIDDLYTLYPATNHPALDHPPDSIEKQFFSILDDDAAKVHRKLNLTGLKDISIKDRYAWALFLNSLIERSPSRVTQVEATDLADTLRNELIEKWGHSKFLDKIDLHAMSKNSVRYVLVNRIKNSPFIKSLTEMKWAVVYLSIEGEHFVTGDKPIVTNAGQNGQPIYCLSLPISPNRLFIAHSSSSDFDDDFLRVLAATHNVIIMRCAEKYVVSSKKLDDGPHTKYSRAIRDFLNRRPDAEHCLGSP